MAMENDGEGGRAAGGGTAAVVTARLFAGLEGLARERRAEAAVPTAQAPTVAALCESLGVPLGAVGLVLVNGVHAALESELRSGDDVSLFPPVGGG
jgi:sulfur-carrier protein